MFWTDDMANLFWNEERSPSCGYAEVLEQEIRMLFRLNSFEDEFARCEKGSRIEKNFDRQAFNFFLSVFR